jgi:tRNA-Thr(GGU) m(6)t(6)A37 methyltransferase TsaA
MKPISKIETPFPEKFGVPRQPLLIEEAWGKMVFVKNDFFMEAFRGIEESSHLWLIFEFHEVSDGEFKGLVRPPRFENQKKMGVYATRTPHRPNRLGLSVVKFDKLSVLDNRIELWVRGVDLVSGTPVFDIKPYVPYVDSVEAKSPFAEKPEFKKVEWLCEKNDQSVLIEKVIALDPRPGQSRAVKDKHVSEVYGVSVAGFNVRFRYALDHFEILQVE